MVGTISVVAVAARVSGGGDSERGGEGSGDDSAEEVGNMNIVTQMAVGRRGCALQRILATTDTSNEPCS